MNVPPRPTKPTPRTSSRLLLASTGKDWAALDKLPEEPANPQLEELKAKFQRHLTDVILSENLIVLTGLGTSLPVKGVDGKPLAPTMGDLWTAAAQKAGNGIDAVKAAVSYAPEPRKENIEHLLSRCQMSERLHQRPDVGTFITDTEGIIVSKCRFCKRGFRSKPTRRLCGSRPPFDPVATSKLFRRIMTSASKRLPAGQGLW